MKGPHAAAAALAALFLLPLPVGATPAPRDPGEKVAPAPLDRDDDWGFIASAKAAAEKRNFLKGGPPSFTAADQEGVRVSGSRAIAVFPILYRNGGQAPHARDDLQDRLFSPDRNAGGLTDYFSEVSYNEFTVTGTVFDWFRLAEEEEHYVGADFDQKACKGRCANARFEEAVAELIAAYDSTIDFRDYDNDGPDEQANTADDNGSVDFFVIVHPDRGGECDALETAPTSHHRVLAKPIDTADIAQDGYPISVNSYVVAPSTSCDNGNLVEIGVFAHEIGHGLKLPDLYDTESDDGESSGVGEWSLMGLGSWGADRNSPQLPTHMSVWEKAELGWVRPTPVLADDKRARLRAIEDWPDALSVAIDDSSYYLIEYRKKVGFDSRLPGSGLLVWRIDGGVLKSKRPENKVNANEANQGIELVEADGKTPLDEGKLASAGDLFRGEGDVRRFDKGSKPPARKVSLCAIGAPEDLQRLQIYISRSRCPLIPLGPPPPP